MSTWYYAGAERQQLGPVSTDELKQFFHSERIGLETLVWRDGMLHWRPLQELAQQLGLLEAIAATETASALPQVGPPPIASVPEPELETAPVETPARVVERPVTGRAVFDLGTEPSPVPTPVRPATTPAFASATPVFSPAPAAVGGANPYAAGYANLQGEPLSAHHEFVVDAGFWKRVAASIIDSLIVGFVGRLAGELIGTVLSDVFSGGDLAEALMIVLCTLLIYTLYFAWFHSALSATPGKMVIGIKVARTNGEPISFLRAIGRYMAQALSTIPLFLGFVMAAFTARKQALHDFICDTVVVDKWAYTDQPELQRTELGTATIVVLTLYGLMLLLVFVAVLFLGVGAAMLRS